jgi:thymidylate synthase
MSHSLTINDQTFVSDTWDLVYKKYLENILETGEVFVGRNGETRAVFGCSAKVDTRLGFPLTSLRKMPFKNLVREFLFDVGLSTNVESLGPAKHFWDFLADENGWLGASAYNRQWRQWPPSAFGSEVPNETLLVDRSVDQLNRVHQLLKDTPNSRHGTVITSNPTATNVACPPCHLAMQFTPSNGWLDLMVPARSNDMIVGFPLDIARYSIILQVMAKLTELTARFVYMPSANSHIYQNCYDIAKELIDRPAHSDPSLIIADREFTSFDDLQLDDFEIGAYEPSPAIKVGVN